MTYLNLLFWSLTLTTLDLCVGIQIRNNLSLFLLGQTHWTLLVQTDSL